MAKSNSSGLGASPVASAMLSPLPRTLGGNEEKGPEYRITEAVGGARGYRTDNSRETISLQGQPPSYSGPRLVSGCGSCDPYRAAA